MKILKFRIQNYKSIVDSQDCYPSEGVSILAGKNESGKTSILEALEDFNVGKKIRQKSIPIQNPDATPKISITFLVPKIQLEPILKQAGFSVTLDDEDNEITITKIYPDSYNIGNDILNKLGYESKKIETITAEVEEHIVAIEKIVRANEPLQSIPFPEVNGTLTEKMSAIDLFIEQSREQITALPEEIAKELNDKVASVSKLVQSSTNTNSIPTKFFKEFKKHLPNFILFSSFDDVFPNTIPLAELESNKWIKDLEVISDIDIKTIKSDDDRRKVTHKTKLNIQLNEDFGKFWEQDLSKLLIDWDNGKLLFWIEEDSYYYEPEIRSQGRRWHLAFYIRISARAKENKDNIILIDEPGLYLHAKAQRDILKKLEEASIDASIMFSTHSPYLLEADKLERIRLIYKPSTTTGTIIENKIHKVSDQETLTPILTAIGLEMNDGITNIEKLNNVIVEGPSDWYFLQAFKKLVNDQSPLNFIYGGGASNMPKVGTILQGWGCNVIYLYDNDQGHKDALKNIKSHWVTTTKEMVEKIPIAGGSIEDVFSSEDYKKLVIKEPTNNFSEPNSDYAKSRDKVIDAKLFLESLKGDTVTIDKETKKNATALLDTIYKKLKESQT